jgi:hypothetical protein
MSVQVYVDLSTGLRRSPIEATNSGGTVQVPGDPGGKGRITVHAYVFAAKEPVDVKWVSGGVDLTGWMPLVEAGHGLDPGWSDYGHIQGLPGKALELHLSASVNVGGHLSFSYR